MSEHIIKVKNWKVTVVGDELFAQQVLSTLSPYRNFRKKSLPIFKWVRGVDLDQVLNGEIPLTSVEFYARENNIPARTVRNLLREYEFLRGLKIGRIYLLVREPFPSNKEEFERHLLLLSGGRPIAQKVPLSLMCSRGLSEVCRRWADEKRLLYYKKMFFVIVGDPIVLEFWKHNGHAPRDVLYPPPFSVRNWDIFRLVASDEVKFL